MRKTFSEYLPYRFKKRVQRFKVKRNFNFKLKSLLFSQLSPTQISVTSSNSELSGFKVLIPWIESNHYQYLQGLAIAKSMQLRGAEVKVLLCGECLTGCEIKSVKNIKDSDPCWECRFNRKHIVSLFGLEVIHLNDVLNDEEIRALNNEAIILGENPLPELIRNGIKLNQCIEDSIIRYYYGNVPNESEELVNVRIAHTHTALIAAAVTKRIDEQWAPTIVFNNMYCYSAWEPFFRYFRAHGNRFRSISISPYNFKSILLDSFTIFQDSKRYLNYLDHRSSKYLLPEENTKLNCFLSNRFSGQSQIFKDWGYFDDSTSNRLLDDLKLRLNLDTSKRNIFLFSNIYWDIGMSDYAGLYQGIISWVIDTIELLKDNNSCHLYIKPHPGEVFDSSTSLKGVSQVIREKYSILPTNVTIIEPQERINTYSLFPLIDVGVIFNGTLGLEMMLNGVPVISTGKTTFEGLGFTFEPKSREDYAAALLGIKQINLPNKSELEMYAYFYFIKTLIPWTLTKQSYADEFTGFNFSSVEYLNSDKDKYLDHIINCIAFPESTCFEDWE